MPIAYPILFITSNLGGGGAERALSIVLKHLDRSRFQPHLALFQKEGVFLENIPADIPVYEIQPTDRGALQRNWVRFRAIQDLCQRIQPALVMSIKWQANAVTLISARLARLRAPVVINEQTAPRASTAFDRRRRLLWPLAKQFYRQADGLIVISQGIADELRVSVGVQADKIHVIHNPLDLAEIDRQVHKNDLPQFKTAGSPAILAAGRLTAVKNYPLLLRAMARLLQTHNAHLYILGQGPEQAHMEALVAQLGLTANVHLLGFVPEPHPYIAQADLFVLTSNLEGFGNVLIEAMSLGVPVVSTDCPYGPREILSDGKYGLLVPIDDEVALAQALAELLDHPEKRAALAQSGRLRALDFSIEKIIRQYETLFLRLIEG